jgi:hypothetical protein
LLNTGIAGGEAIGTIGLYDLDTTDFDINPINDEGQGASPLFNDLAGSIF